MPFGGPSWKKQSKHGCTWDFLYTTQVLLAHNDENQILTNLKESCVAFSDMTSDKPLLETSWLRHLESLRWNSYLKGSSPHKHTQFPTCLLCVAVKRVCACVCWKRQ